MPKRTYNRRSDEEIVRDLEAKIAALKQKQEAKARPDAAVVKALPRFKKQLSAFAQLCLDYDRADLSNSVLAFMSTLERQLGDGPPS